MSTLSAPTRRRYNGAGLCTTHLRAALKNCAAGRTKVATVMRHAAGPAERPGHTGCRAASRLVRKPRVAAGSTAALVRAKTRTRARDREAQGQWLVANSMRRGFPFWPSVGEFCPSITVNSTGVAITATSSNAIE